MTQHFEIFQKIELNRCSANFRDPQYIFIGKRTTKRRQNDPKYRYSPTNESVELHRKVVARRIKSSLNRRATRTPVISQSSRIVWYYGIVMDDTIDQKRDGTRRDVTAIQQASVAKSSLVYRSCISYHLSPVERKISSRIWSDRHRPCAIGSLKKEKKNKKNILLFRVE